MIDGKNERMNDYLIELLKNLKDGNTKIDNITLQIQNGNNNVIGNSNNQNLSSDCKEIETCNKEVEQLKEIIIELVKRINHNIVNNTWDVDRYKNSLS